MEREEIARSDFPKATDGYDRRAVDAHLAAVAAFADALQARIVALGVEIDALRGSVPEEDRNGAAVPEATVAADIRADARPEPENLDSGDRSDDPVAARLVVSKLHLEGADREEIIARIVSGYRVEDPEGLVDEVIEGLS